MKAVIQRVSDASCTVGGQVTGSIGRGLLIYFCAEDGDRKEILEPFLAKISSLRIFRDADDKMNLSLADTGGSILLISQFTIVADIRRGRRPSFDRAMRAEEARSFYEEAAGILRKMGFHVETGIFGADMRIAYANDGPVTIIADSRELGLSDQASGCV